MATFKRLIIMPYLLCCLLATVHSLIYLLSQDSLSLAWLGSFIAVAPMLAFMFYLSVAGVGRTSRHPVDPGFVTIAPAGCY